jgi:hypothetical protein
LGDRRSQGVHYRNGRSQDRREAFGKVLIDHEGVGFTLADNLIERV